MIDFEMNVNLQIVLYYILLGKFWVGVLFYYLYYCFHLQYFIILCGYLYDYLIFHYLSRLLFLLYFCFGSEILIVVVY